MKNPCKFITLKHGEVVMLPREIEIPELGIKIDYVHLVGDYFVFGLSTRTRLWNGKGEMKTLRELYEEQNG